MSRMKGWEIRWWEKELYTCGTWMIGENSCGSRTPSGGDGKLVSGLSLKLFPLALTSKASINMSLTWISLFCKHQARGGRLAWHGMGWYGMVPPLPGHGACEGRGPELPRELWHCAGPLRAAEMQLERLELEKEKALLE